MNSRNLHIQLQSEVYVHAFDLNCTCKHNEYNFTLMIALQLLSFTISPPETMFPRNYINFFWSCAWWHYNGKKRSLDMTAYRKCKCHHLNKKKKSKIWLLTKNPNKRHMKMIRYAFCVQNTVQKIYLMFFHLQHTAGKSHLLSVALPKRKSLKKTWFTSQHLPNRCL